MRMNENLTAARLHGCGRLAVLITNLLGATADAGGATGPELQDMRDLAHGVLDCMVGIPRIELERSSRPNGWVRGWYLGEDAGLKNSACAQRFVR
jgi:hypothetical protein